jgi:AraC-like DNA-binding protein
MRSSPRLPKTFIPEDAGVPAAGLLRKESSTLGSAPLRQLFSNLRGLSRGELIGEHPYRHLEGARLRVDRSQGHGSWELYKVGEDFYVVASDFVYDSMPVETEPGEGLVEFHLRLSGVLEMTVPGAAGAVTVAGPQLLMLYLPPGVNITERVQPRQRDASVTVYCSLGRLRDLATQNRVGTPSLFEELEHLGSSVWFRQLDLTPTLRFAATTLLESPYHGGVRLLHAEAKALEILCEVFCMFQHEREDQTNSHLASVSEARQLEAARRVVTSNLASPVSIREIARVAGMSESKLKRAFKARYGCTIFHYGLEVRMKQALEMLRCKRMSVGQVSYAVGYTHQTSFTAAFHEFFGFPPSKARSDVH